MHSRDDKRLFQINLGLTRYKETWDLQKKLVTLRHQGKIPDCLIVTEHEPVITLGRGTHRKNILAEKVVYIQKGIEIFEVERGGDVTFHGPGQVVLYPILDLDNHRRDLHRYLRKLEKLIIMTLGDFDLEATTKPDLTGVWVDDHKLAAIGVAVSHWITFHGLALNVSTDLDYFKLINPCGITEYPVGSMSVLTGRDFDIKSVSEQLVKNFAALFCYGLEKVNDIEKLLNELIST